MTTLYFKDLFTSNLPIHIAETVIQNEEKTNLHDHDFNEFFYIKEGTLRYFLNDKEYQLTPRCLCFVFPEDAHCLQKNHDTKDVVLINVAFPKELFEEMRLFFSHQSNDVHFLSFHTILTIDEDVLQLLDSRVNLLKKLRPDTPNEVKKIMVKTLLSDVFTQFIEDNNISRAVDSVPAWLRNACGEMEKAENYSLGLPRFLELCNKSQEHVARSMKKYYNDTPTGYINNIRLREVAKQLMMSNKNIVDLAFESGFGNISYFNTCFKRKYGISAREYRKVNLRTIESY